VPALGQLGAQRHEWQVVAQAAERHDQYSHDVLNLK
jgi:hypothetical protein